MTTGQIADNNTPDLNWGMDEENASSTSAAAQAGAAAEATVAIAAAAASPETSTAAETTASVAPVAEGASVPTGEGAGEGAGEGGADGEEGAAEVANKLALLNAERAAALKKVEDKFAKREFDLRRKSQSMSERKGVAFDAMESMRQRVRDQIEQPYMDDAAVDALIEKAFVAGLGTLSAE